MHHYWLIIIVYDYCFNIFIFQENDAIEWRFYLQQDIA